LALGSGKSKGSGEKTALRRIKTWGFVICLAPIREPKWKSWLIGVALVAGVVLLSIPTLALADEVSKGAKIEEMIQLTHADRMVQQIIEQMKTMSMAQFSKMEMPAGERQAADELQQKLMALLSDRLSWDKMKPAYLKLYGDTFSEDEIDGIVTFYKSPAGKAMIEKMPVLMQKSMALGQQLMGDVMPEIKRMTEELTQKYKK
jgi:uncharacterized protein